MRECERRYTGSEKAAAGGERKAEETAGESEWARH